MTTTEGQQATTSKKLRAFFSKCLVSKKTVVLVFALFLLCGAFFYDDYGISNDEEMEHITSEVNYVHVFGPILLSSEHDSVRAAAENVPELATYEDRYYGAALQCVTLFVEHLFSFQMSERNIYLMRHAFVFLNYFIAGVCFYFILYRRFGRTALPLLGVLAYILFPRFFGEAFYNIKDSLFFSWMVISGYLTLRWLEESKPRYYFFAAAALALAINTRILGLSLLLLACAFSIIISIRNKEAFLRTAGRPLALLGLTLALWVLITPYLWANPLKNMTETFDFFLNVVEWDNAHLYMGEMISRHVPWHYLPVWMGITIPIPYILMFFVGIAGIGAKAFGGIKRYKATRTDMWADAVEEEQEAVDLAAMDATGEDEAHTGGPVGARLEGTHLYDLFMASLFICTLLGYIVLDISMYEGWRHAYGIYFPFIYIAVYGLASAINFLNGKHVAFRRMGAAAVFACFTFLFGWILANHPHEYVFFNSIGRLVAERNFTLDFWEVSHIDLVRYVLARDDRPEIMIYSSGGPEILLPEEEKARVIITNMTDVDYYLLATRGPYESRVTPEGFEETASIVVDGMKISTIYKNLDDRPAQAETDPAAIYKIVNVLSNIEGGDFDAMFDGDLTTSWTTGRPQQPKDSLFVEFMEPVNYDYFSFGAEYPRELSVYLSADGMGGPVMPVTEIEGGYRFTYRTEDYRFIVFEVGTEADGAWSIGELQFGHILAATAVNQAP